MNLRILKKLSKRAAPLLPLLGDRRQQFISAEGDNYHGMMIRDRTCWDRSHCHPSYEGWGDDIVWTTRAGHRVVMRPPSNPLPGTIMVGEMSGYYEPEWEEECAWGALHTIVALHFTDWSAEHCPVSTRRTRTPSEVFRGAMAIIAGEDQNSRGFTDWKYEADEFDRQVDEVAE